MTNLRRNVFGDRCLPKLSGALLMNLRGMHKARRIKTIHFYPD
jgi:hypothetical protein